MRTCLSIVLALLASCSSDIYLRDGVTDGDTFHVAPVALIDSDPVLQSWVAYSLARSTCQLEIGGENPARNSSFACELSAREILVDAWAEHRAEEAGIGDRYLDQLAEVQGAGFLDEYTAHFLWEDGWQVPYEVDADAFDIWRRQYLRRHRVRTRMIGYWSY
jgi:hypothetical protein